MEEQRLYLTEVGEWEGFRIYVFNNDAKLSILKIDNEISLSWKGILYSYNFLSLWHLTTVSLYWLSVALVAIWHITFYIFYYFRYVFKIFSYIYHREIFSKSVVVVNH